MGSLGIDGLRFVVGVVTALAVVAAIGAAGLLVGSRSGQDLDAARASGAAAGQRQGERAGARAGYEDGVARGREAVFRRSYDEAYRAAYRRAFEQAGVRPPGRITVYGD